MNRHLVLVMTLGAATAVASAQESQTSAKPFPSEVIASRVLARQLAKASTDERVGIYQRLVAAAPGNAAHQLGLIAAYLQKLRETGDIEYLNRAARLVEGLLEKDSGNFAALRYQNEIDLQRHDFRTVVERAEMMIKDDPSDPGSWANLGDASMELGNYERAGQAYLRMFALRPGLGSYNRLAYWRFVTGDGATAIQLMQTAVEAGDDAPENTAWCLAELGDMEFKLGKVSEAAEAYTAALDRFPRLHRALAGLGKTEASLGHIAPAIQHYERAQAIVPLVEYAGALEDLYSASGLVKKAENQRALVSAIQTLGTVTNEKTNRNLALLLADHGRDLGFALKVVEAEVPVRGDVYTWDALSWVLFKSGRIEEAQAASAKALKLNTPEPVFYYHASKIAAAAGLRDVSRSYVDRLLSLNAKFDFSKSILLSENVLVPR